MKVSNIKSSKSSLRSSLDRDVKRSVSKSPKKRIAVKSPPPTIEMFIDVNIRDKKFRIHCSGKQTFKWLQNAALHYYDQHYGLHSGKPVIMIAKDKDETVCNSADIIQKLFKANAEVSILFIGNCFCLFLDEFELYVEKKKSKKTLRKLL
jgi:hypothetical protein